MVYAFIQDVPIGEDMYRTIIDALGPEPMKGSSCTWRCAGPEGGLRYIDVWESEEDCTRAFERANPPRSRLRASVGGEPARSGAGGAGI